MSTYSRLNPTVGNSEGWSHGDPTICSNNADAGLSEGTKHTTFTQMNPDVSEEGSNHDKPPFKERPNFKLFGSKENRTNSGFSIPKGPRPAWEHRLSEKYLHNVPSNSDTTRYFNRRRQTRRVFIDGFIMWCGTLVICLLLFGVMYGFSTIRFGLSQTQKYAYNALITGLSIFLGLAFAAQFKQYAEMMRWRFLTAHYRSLQQFEEVLGCDSYRNTLRIMFTHRRPGAWYPSKSQVIAGFWFLVFVAFNVFAALLGLTYSIDVSNNFVYVQHGEVSVTDLKYIANHPQPDNGQKYAGEFQKASANLWGQVGQNFQQYYNDISNPWSPLDPAVFTDANDTWYYRFVDLAPTDSKSNIVTTRTVTSSATCQEYTITFGGYAGWNTNNATDLTKLSWLDEYGTAYTEYVSPAATGSTTWMGNSTSACGARCAQILALQTANNVTVADVAGTDYKAVPKPRLWACNNKVSQVANYDSYLEGFDHPERLTLPDAQAFYLAGSIGWTGVTSDGSDLQFLTIDGDTDFSPSGNITATGMASLLMRFTVSALAAMDQRGGPRFNQTGYNSPSPAQVVNIKWPFAGAILAGIPFLQFIMLLGVVWFSGKAVILEPAYLTAAHLMRPVLDKMGASGRGSLLSSEEMAERLGGDDFKIAYGVRPDGEDPGPHDNTYVRHLTVVDESDGFGKLTRGKMPKGRYD